MISKKLELKQVNIFTEGKNVVEGDLYKGGSEIKEKKVVTQGEVWLKNNLVVISRKQKGSHLHGLRGIRRSLCNRFSLLLWLHVVVFVAMGKEGED